MKVRGTLVGLGWLASQILGGNAFAFKIVSFDAKFTRWDQSQIHYVVDSRGSKYFKHDASKGCDSKGSCKTVREIAKESFATWSKVPGVKLDFVEDAPKVVDDTGYDHQNSITWTSKGWQSLSFNPPPSALAVTISTYTTSDAKIVDSDTHVNEENFAWADINSTDEEQSNLVDLQNILTHELGHFIGMDHSSENLFEANTKLYLATMFFASGAGEMFRRNLGDDDKEGVINLYPEHEHTEPVVEGITPDTIDLTTGTTVMVQIQGRNFADYSSALIAVKGEHGDVVAHSISTSDTEMNVAFDLSALPSGKYDVVVANSHDRLDRLEGAITITGGLAGGFATNDENSQSSGGGGGCSISTDTDNVISSLIFLIFPLILIAASRIALNRKQKP